MTQRHPDGQRIPAHCPACGSGVVMVLPAPSLVIAYCPCPRCGTRLSIIKAPAMPPVVTVIDTERVGA